MVKGSKEKNEKIIISQQELFVLAINKNTSYNQLALLLDKFGKTEHKIGALEKALMDKKIARESRKLIYALLGKYYDLYAWEKTGINSKLSRDEKLQIKETHYKKSIDNYLEAGFENGTNVEISKLANEYLKLAYVYQEMGRFKTEEFLKCSKKGDELLVKCGRKKLNPQTRPLTEQEKKREIENSKHPHAIPYKTYP